MSGIEEIVEIPGEPNFSRSIVENIRISLPLEAMPNKAKNIFTALFSLLIGTPLLLGAFFLANADPILFSCRKYYNYCGMANYSYQRNVLAGIFVFQGIMANVKLRLQGSTRLTRIIDRLFTYLTPSLVTGDEPRLHMALPVWPGSHAALHFREIIKIGKAVLSWA